jgi:hypothetical protein
VVATANSASGGEGDQILISHIRSSSSFFATIDHDVVRARGGRRYRWGKRFFSPLPQPRVNLAAVSQFADGHSYSKNKMDEILRSGALDKLPPRQKEHHPHVKREDVELIVGCRFEQAAAWRCHLRRGTDNDQRNQVHELEIPKSQAEKALHEAGGDVSKALKALITPKEGFGTEKSSRK